MSFESNCDQLREIARNEVQNFANEFLPSIEETLHFMEKSKMLESQVKLLETKMTSLRGLIQSSMLEIDKVSKQLAKPRPERSKKGQIIGEYPLRGYSREQGRLCQTVSQKFSRPPKTVKFDGAQLAEQEGAQKDFFEKLQGESSKKENVFEQSMPSRSGKKKGKRGKDKNKEKREAAANRLVEKRIKKLERDQKKFEEVVQGKLDIVISEVQKVSLAKRVLKSKPKKVTRRET